ncbi:hypothetical protein [Nocardia pseudobrasiliensis]|uniref:Uncharacterized protein n=1 Tax=Nocardia pseudobrasiliensis TaxID=45979 RepID=A0A370IED0_9NOCA|nr:hypothetical protein [Nocardia pseudobrasiliensis]RDI69086.1 hypothetical protein DFR76_101624 [Nocardia pseudobrasiliensis]
MGKRFFITSAITLAGIGLGAGFAYADEVEVEGSYSTQAACQTDGPHVQVNRDNDTWTHYDCRNDKGDGLWHLYLSR